MSLPSSGSISMSQIRSELGQSGAISLGAIKSRELSGKFTGSVAMSHFRGKYNMESIRFRTGENVTRGLGFDHEVYMSNYAVIRRSSGFRTDTWLTQTAHIECDKSWLPDGTVLKYFVSIVGGTREGVVTVPGNVDIEIESSRVNGSTIHDYSYYDTHNEMLDISWEIIY